MKVELATCPASWGVFWADGSPSYVPYELFLDHAASAGYKGIELGPVGYLPTEPAALRKELDKRGLVARAGTACYNFDEMSGFADLEERAKSLCSLLKSFDIRYLVMMDESPAARTAEGKKAFTSARIAKNLGIIREYVDFAKTYDVTVVFHPHMNTIVETEGEIVEMMEKTNCMLCYDTGHHQVVNGKPEKGDRCAIDFYLKHHDRIPFLHFKNVDGEAMKKRAADPGFKGNVFCPLEDGVIDFKEFAEALRAVGYDGIGVVEQDMAGEPAEKSFRLAIRNREYLQRMGVARP